MADHRDEGRPPAPVAGYLRRHREQLLPVLFVLPAIAYVGYFAFYPAIDAVVLSFQTPILSFTFYNYQANVGFGLYTWIANTLWLTIGALALQFGLALGIASIINRNFRGKRIFATIAILPIGISTVVAGYAFSTIFPGSGGGYASSVLAVVGYHQTIYWLQTPAKALLAVIIADSWKNTALVVIILVAGYASIPSSLYQAAAIDGAGPLRQFWYVTLPGIRGFIVIALLIRGAQEFNIFQLALEIIGQYPQLITVQIYVLYTSGEGIYLASAVASVLLGIVSLFILVVLLLGARQ